MKRRRFHHILIGTPASGKSCLAAKIAQFSEPSVIISTDQIREEIYGDEIIQGRWDEIEQIVLKRIQQAISQRLTIIYDATNARRAWRLQLLQKLKNLTKDGWVGWWLKTPIEQCYQWNRTRSRHVPEDVISRAFNALKKFPPIEAEGFIKVFAVDVSPKEFTIQEYNDYLKTIKRSITNRRNRTRYYQLHRYSNLIDFERLMYLLSGIIHHFSCDFLGEISHVNLEEITMWIKKRYGAVYAHVSDIEQDIEWLKNQSFIGNQAWKKELDIPPLTCNLAPATHAYSDWVSFERLMQVLRFIIHYPFTIIQELGSLDSLITIMSEQGVINPEQKAQVRKDIELVLKPYDLLPEQPMRHGYYTATGIFSRHELTHLYRLLDLASQSLEPLDLDLLATFRQRMIASGLAVESTYPVRQIGNYSMVDPETTSTTSLLQKNYLEKVEKAILSGRLIEIQRIKNSAYFEGENLEPSLVWPLQLLFYNHAWYLGCESTDDPPLFCFLRLDRLSLGRPQFQQRSPKEQMTSLKKLHRLFNASAGIFLGRNSSWQAAYLSGKSLNKEAVEFILELWFQEDIFRFISEGTRRFQYQQMSSQPGQVRSQSSLFCLPLSPDPVYRYRLRARLPRWCIEDVDLKRWIVGFGGKVRVVSPPELMEIVARTGQEIARLYTHLE